MRSLAFLISSLLLLPALVLSMAPDSSSSSCAKAEKEADAKLGTLPKDVRDALAQKWVENGLAEHASVASFSRFSLQLMSVAAPASLLEAAHLAAMDEIKHAKLCFRLAAKFGERQMGPGPFPIPDGKVEVATNVLQMALSVAVEGCVGETLSVVRAAAQIATCHDPSVKKVLETIAEDEARHAGLAWKTVRWALSLGDSEVVDQVTKALYDPFDELAPSPTLSPAEQERAELLQSYGVLSDRTSSEMDLSHRAWLLPPLIQALTNSQTVVNLDWEHEASHSADIRLFVTRFLKVAGFTCGNCPGDTKVYQHVVPSVEQLSSSVDDAHTTYRLVVTLKNDAVSVYSLVGTGAHPLLLPPAYQVKGATGSHYGGADPAFFEIKPESQYDSWLTVGLTEGNSGNALAAIGLDNSMSAWTEQQGIQNKDCAVFWMDPSSTSAIATSGAITLAQLTLPTGTTANATVSLVGDAAEGKQWSDMSVHFTMGDAVQDNGAGE
jgi:hypothetical protein